MEKFCQDPSLAREMGIKSREFAEEKYDVELVNRVIITGMGIVQANE